MKPTSDEKRREAERSLEAYRSGLKLWTLALVGVVEGDEAKISRQLEGLEAALQEVALQFPDLAYDIDMLVNARRRSGYIAEVHPGRPHSRMP